MRGAALQGADSGGTWGRGGCWLVCSVEVPPARCLTGPALESFCSLPCPPRPPHLRAVNRLAVAGCGSFFVSASSDETVKVWDCRRLEKDVSFRSRLTYAAQAGRITAVAACQDGHTVASGSASGSIHVWRVEAAAGRAGGYQGIVGVRQVGAGQQGTHSTGPGRGGWVGCTCSAALPTTAEALQYTTNPLHSALPHPQVSPGGGAVLDLAAWGPSLLVHASQQGGVAAWDLRAGCDAWALPCPPSAGVVERFVLDPASQNWLLAGSSRGQLTLWDARFLLPVNAWQHPAGAPISALALAQAPAQRLGLAGGAAPLAYVAAGEQEVGLWDVSEARCLQVGS